MFKYISKLDWILIMPMVLLLATGLLAIYSLSINNSTDSFNIFDKQLIFVGVALVVFFVFSFTDYRIWRNYTSIFYIASIVLLLLVFLIGKTTNGAVSWFKIGFLNFQPVEFVKIASILLLAKYFSQIQSQNLLWKNLFVSFAYILPPVVLVILQPDMGSAIVLVAIWLTMVFLAGLNLRQIIVLTIIGILIGASGWFFVLHDYQKARVVSFLNPGQDALGAGYNVNQAMIAIGSGSLVGKGVGHGSQSQLNFIPERHTDFIFATIAEESGLLGAGLVLLFFGIIFWRFKNIIELSKDRFGQLIVGGVAGLMFFQILINIGMNLGLMPVAGLSLPFLSYGGSFLLTIMILMGMSENVWLRK